MSVELRFDSQPSLLKTYVRFLVGRRPGLKTSQSLPAIAASWPGLEVDQAKLARYRDLCCIQKEPGLPLHFPHLLAGPVHLTMLTEPEFPLGMLGALHLRNHAIRYRPIEPDEKLALTAHIRQARFRPQGIEFDLDTELTTGDERVWAERTTFLVRKKGLKEDDPSPLAEIFPWDESDKGQELTSFLIPPRAGKDFAAVSGDYNPIHVSRWLARLFGFKRDLVHGMWAVARATAGMPELESAEPVRVDIAFKGPLFMEHKIVVLERECPGGRTLRFFCGSEPRPAVQVVVRAVNAQARPEQPPE